MLHNELGSLFSFTSYRLLRDENLNLSLNQPVSISAREGRIIMEITLVGLHKSVAELRIRVDREGTEILNTQVRLSPGRTVLIGGPKLTVKALSSMPSMPIFNIANFAYSLLRIQYHYSIIPFISHFPIFIE